MQDTAIVALAAKAHADLIKQLLAVERDEMYAISRNSHMIDLDAIIFPQERNLNSTETARFCERLHDHIHSRLDAWNRDAQLQGLNIGHEEFLDGHERLLLAYMT